MMVESYLAIQQNYVDAALQANPDEKNISLNEEEVCKDITQTLYKQHVEGSWLL